MIQIELHLYNVGPAPFVAGVSESKLEGSQAEPGSEVRGKQCAWSRTSAWSCTPALSSATYLHPVRSSINFPLEMPETLVIPIVLNILIMQRSLCH